MHGVEVMQSGEAAVPRDVFLVRAAGVLALVLMCRPRGFCQSQGCDMRYSFRVFPRKNYRIIIAGQRDSRSPVEK